MNKVASCLLISLLIFFSNTFAQNTCLSPSATLNKPLKIIAIGDSLTQGGGQANEYTYRLPLAMMLKKAGYEVDFIGTQHAGLDSAFKWPVDFDADHEGFYGATTAEVAAHLKTDLAKIAAPDIALIHLGTSDFASYNVFKTVVKPMRSIIAQLRKQNPKVRILISQIHLNGLKAKYFRLYLNGLAKYETSPKSRVETVADYIEFTKEDTFDGMHPNLSGQTKMAKAWFKQLEWGCDARAS